MPALTYIAVFCLLLFADATLLSTESPAQETRFTKEPTARITGRVTLDGKAIKGVVVILTSAGSRRDAIAKAKTDDNGRYELTKIPAGQYTIAPFAIAFVAASSGSFGQTGKPITIDEDESSEEMNFELAKGGVITGRITDWQGQPAVGERVVVWQLDEQNRERPFKQVETDDRGIYRAYGLPAGRFKVSAGEDSRTNKMRIGMAKSPYTMTYHPDTTDRSRAGIVEVTTGSEATSIDIRINNPTKTYTASGRVIDAETGKPVANVNCAYHELAEGGVPQGGLSGLPPRTNARGEFRFENVLPGRYAAFARFEGNSESYSDAVAFQIDNGDISGLEIKVRRGSSLSGVIVFEGANDPKLASIESELRIAFLSDEDQSVGSRGKPARIEPDGSFRLQGLRPGKGRFYLGRSPNLKDPPAGFWIIRVERGGIEQPVNIEIGAGEQVSGIRIFVAYGTGVVRGQVKVEGGSLPEGVQMFVGIRRLDRQVPWREGRGLPVDVRGRFIIEGLASGEYELILIPRLAPDLPPESQPLKVSQKVTVTNGAETPVTIVLNLGNSNDQT